MLHLFQKIVNDTGLTNPNYISNAFNEYFCNIGPNLAKNLNPPKTGFVHYCHSPIKNSMYCKPVQSSEIIDIVSHFNINKSAGPDSIGPKLLKRVVNELVDPLQFIYNLSFSTASVPSKLKISKVIPVYKKGVAEDPCNYRPISLLSIFEKILEKLMYNRMYDFLNKHEILYKYQFGFRKNHSTVLALVEMIDNLYNNIDNNNVTVGVYLDLQKAFDTVDHNILLYKLNVYGIRGLVLDWFRDYLSDRKQFVALADATSDLMAVTHGVSQ